MSAFDSAPIFFDQKRFSSDLNSHEPVQVFKNALNAANHHFHNRFNEGDEAHRLVRERAAFVDLMLQYAWKNYDWDTSICLIAVGGYGRGQLHPYSDIDLLILAGKNVAYKYKKSIEQYLAFLWDARLQISHSVRSIRQCVDAAKNDITIATNLMETRLICGNKSNHKKLIQSTGPHQIWSSAEFYAGKLDEQKERHKKHDDTEYNLEPNVKDAPGGLRDVQLIDWTAKRHFNVTRRSQLVEKGFLLQHEYLKLYADEEFLWKVRYGLHLIADRAEERLLFDHQRTLAKMLGYEDMKGKLGVEKFMQKYYQTVLSIRGLNDVLHQHLDEAIYRDNKTKHNSQISEHFFVRDGLLDTISHDTFRLYPTGLIEIFVILGENNEIEGIRASTIRQIRHSTHLIDANFRADAKNRKLFMRLLNAPYRLSFQLNRMNRYGILGKYLPEFGKIVGQMQHDLFHIYPVDVHTLEVIKNIRRLARPEVAKQFPIPSHIFKNLAKPELLIISALYHDIAKGRGGDHSSLGAADVADFSKRHELQENETKLVRWLVKNHLIMSFVSQREDISDPQVIHRFAEQVGDQMHLDYLYVLTVGDINATNPNLWTEWKGSLLQNLYMQTKKALERGLGIPIDKSRWSQNAKNVISMKLLEHNIALEQAEKIWGDIGDEFFLRETADDIARYTTAIAQYKEQTKASEDRRMPVVLLKDVGVEILVATQIFVFSQKEFNTLSIAAAVLDKLNLNIQDARLHTNSDDNSFDVFYVLDTDGAPVGGNRILSDQICSSLRQAILNPDSVDFDIKRRTPRQLKSFTKQTTAKFKMDAESNSSWLEVITPDRPGLLARIANIFFRYNLRVVTAKISTLGERVEDVFHLTHASRKPIADPALTRRVEETICEELSDMSEASR